MEFFTQGLRWMERRRSWAGRRPPCGSLPVSAPRAQLDGAKAPESRLHCPHLILGETSSHNQVCGPEPCKGPVQIKV